MFAPQQLQVIKFCADEVQRQEDDAAVVYNYIEAWLRAWVDFRSSAGILDEVMIVRWGQLTLPLKNTRGYRRIPLTRSDGQKIGVTPEEVPRLMARLIANVSSLAPAEVYKEFEEIHPFLDGNGRVGKILYNFLLGTLDSPRMPPDYWREDR